MQELNFKGLNTGNITPEETSIKGKWEKENSVQSLC